jgi:prepilin-type N-terminal cleavage/methylation domain-containing protein
MCIDRSADGFSALELMIVLAILGCVAAISLPATSSMVNELNLSGDAHGVSNSLAQARMIAAANFTRARVRVDQTGGTYRVERWDKTAAAWQAVADDQPLGTFNVFSAGAIETPPPNSQVAVAQPTACLDDAGVAIANTSCVIFNSRGAPVDSAGAPAAVAVIYLSGPTAVFAVVIGSTSQLAMWRSQPTEATWAQK